MKVIPSNKIEIKIGETYTYYVSEDKQKLTFNIENFPKNNSEKIFMTIWAKGYKTINSILLGGKYEKHDKYSVYSIELPIFNENEYNLTVEGTIGDLIDIGSLIFKDETLYKDSHKICQNKSLNNFVEYSGFLKKGIIEENCFLSSSDSLEYLYYYTFKDNEDINKIVSNISEIKTKEEYGYITCITIPNKIKLEKFFILFKLKKCIIIPHLRIMIIINFILYFLEHFSIYNYIQLDFFQKCLKMIHIF